MDQNQNTQKKKCQYCGKYFNPDPRVGGRQKACFRPECKRKRKRETQEEWKKKNPQVLKTHYQDHVKRWRQKRREELRANSEVKKERKIAVERIVLLIPKDKASMIRDEISLKMIAPQTFTADGP